MVNSVNIGLETVVSAAATGSANIRQQLDLAATIELFTPQDFPFLTMVGMDSLGYEVFNTKIEWPIDDVTILPKKDTLDESGNITDTINNFTVDHGEYFKLGDIIRIDSELMWVLGIDGDELYVERDFAGSTKATHNDEATIYILGNARLEGSAPGIARQTPTTTAYNYTQIIDEVVGASGTELAVQNNFGLPRGPALLDYRMQQRLQEMYVGLNMNLYYGLRNQATAVTPGAFGGLIAFVTDTDSLSSAVLQLGHFETALDNRTQEVNAAYMPDVVLGNTWLKRKIAQWYTPMDPVQRLGGIEASRVDTPFGALDYVYDRNLPQNEAWVIKTGMIRMGPLAGRALGEYPIPTDADLSAKRILGEYTVRVDVPQSMVRITGYSTSA